MVSRVQRLAPESEQTESKIKAEISCLLRNDIVPLNQAEEFDYSSVLDLVHHTIINGSFDLNAHSTQPTKTKPFMEVIAISIDKRVKSQMSELFKSTREV